MGGDAMKAPQLTIQVIAPPPLCIQLLRMNICIHQVAL